MVLNKQDKRRLVSLLLAVLGLLGALTLGWQRPASAFVPRHYSELEFPPLGTVEIPDFERYELPNGLVVYLMEDHDLPLVSGSATFRTGSRFEPAAKVGLASITGEAMRLGGTTELSPDALNLALEQRAASVETSFGTTAGSANFSALSEDFETVLGLFADVIEHPGFAQDRLDFLKRRYSGGIARRNDDPGDVISREFRKLIYGTESPYARTTEYATLNAIEREDVLAFYHASVRPETTILGIVGDFDAATTKALIAEYFEGWQGEGPALDTTDLPPVQQAETGYFMVDKPDLTQSYIQIGHLGGLRNSPDYAALSVMNEVLNGFSGRLFNEIRSRQGLAYSVYAFWAARYDYPGTFIGGGQTRSDATVAFIGSIKEEINRIRTTPISAAELQQAQDSVLNSFVFNFANPGQTLSRVMTYEYYDYPADFVFQFQEQVSNTTVEEVQAAAATYLAPEQLVVLVMGDPEAIQPSLSTLSSQVTQLDITIPDSDQA